MGHFHSLHNYVGKTISKIFRIFLRSLNVSKKLQLLLMSWTNIKFWPFGMGKSHFLCLKIFVLIFSNVRSAFVVNCNRLSCVVPWFIADLQGKYEVGDLKWFYWSKQYEWQFAIHKIQNVFSVSQKITMWIV